MKEKVTEDIEKDTKGSKGKEEVRREGKEGK